VGCAGSVGMGEEAGAAGRVGPGAASSPASQVWRVRYTMPGMCSAETTSYIAHHLQLVGRPDQLFTEDALSLIHTTTSPCNPSSPPSPPARTSSTTHPPAQPSARSSTEIVLLVTEADRTER
jgi:hypothetical protein